MLIRVLSSFLLNYLHRCESGRALLGKSKTISLGGYRHAGAHLILSYPHFLYADQTYANGLIGIAPNPDLHRIFLDLEPNTGIVMRGAKRVQFNVFIRPLQGIPSTTNLRLTLTPIFWIEESMLLPEEYVEQLTTSLISTLNLLSILIPILIAVSCVVFVAGIVILATTRFKKQKDQFLASRRNSSGRPSDK